MSRAAGGGGGKAKEPDAPDAVAETEWVYDSGGEGDGEGEVDGEGEGEGEMDPEEAVSDAVFNAADPSTIPEWVASVTTASPLASSAAASASGAPSPVRALTEEEEAAVLDALTPISALSPAATVCTTTTHVLACALRLGSVKRDRHLFFGLCAVRLDGLD
jgi:hypothetical protein